ncbi:MAG: 50S ribosomal protein L30 [Candidatus Diapherotrites archaeon]|nr:50S ribosomal protein L30 [Candidatus Diapherotrites archaeon]
MLAVIRVRGEVDVNPAIKKTLRLLRLDRINHLVLVDEALMPMLRKAQSRITFGEIDLGTAAVLLQKRGRLAGGKRLGEGFLKEKKFKGFEEAAKALLEKKAKPESIGIKPIFMLGPPKGSYERAGIKKPYALGGALGYRGADINLLIKRMV